MHLFGKGRLVSILLTVVLAFGLIEAPAKASSGDKFAGGNNASNILSKYSVFVEGNFNANNHIMGAIAVGGTYTNSNFFGDAAIYPSYIKTWNSGRVGNGALNDNLSKRVNRTVYYGTRSGDLGGNPAVQNSGFLSMSSVFSSLRAQSKALAERGETISGNVIDLTNRNEDVYITVPYSKLNSLQINVSSYDWFRKHILCVSVTGAGSGAQFNGWCIKINGGDIGNNFRFKFPGADSQYNIQLNLSGMNLFWNFPDATSINVMGQAGHLIAPSANVTNTSGNYEGGVIAKSFTSTSEAHFYPCNRTLATSNGKKASPTPTATKVPTNTATPTPTATPVPKKVSPTPTVTPIPKKVSPTPTVTPVPKKATPTPTPVPKKATPTPTPVPKKATPTPTPVPKKATPTPTPEPKKATPTPTPEPKRNVATATPTPTPVPQKLTVTSTPTPTPAPQKNVATATPTPVPKKNTPTATPTPVPYRRPSPTPKPVTPENPDEPKTGHGIFSKVTEKNQELEGARLTLTAYTDGIDLSDIKRASNSGGTDYVASKNTITWTSTASRTILEDLPNGTYRLHEDCAPANYDVAFDIYFRMKGGVICDMDGNPVPDGVLVMIDTSLTDPGHQVAKSSDIPVKEGTGKGVVRSPQTGEQANAGNLVWLLLLVMVAAACPAVFKKRRFLKR